MPTVCVVDTQPGDYQAWREIAQTHRLRLQILSSAAEALRFRRSQRVDLWVVNTNLPGVSGCELCSMLKAQSDRQAVYLVADEYSPALEQAAWNCRATLFGIKGSHTYWLDDWLTSRATRVNGPR